MDSFYALIKDNGGVVMVDIGKGVRVAAIFQEKKDALAAQIAFVRKTGEDLDSVSVERVGMVNGHTVDFVNELDQEIQKWQEERDDKCA